MSDIQKQALKKVLDWVQNMKEFTLDQAPDVIRQLLIAHSIESLMFVTVGCVVFGLAFLFQWKYVFNDSDLDGDVKGPIFLFTSGVMVGSSVFVLTNFYYLLIIQFAPKYYIVKELASLLGG
jgi:hypothetical protein